MPNKQDLTVQLTPEEQEERRQLVIEAQQEDTPSGDFHAPRYKLVSMIQRFQNTLTEETVEELRCIIIAGRKARGFWGEKGVATEANQAPLCSSVDGITGVCQDTDAFVAVAEEHNVVNQIAPFGPAPCDKCPFSQWKGATPPLCKEMRRLLIMVEGHSFPAILSVPPTSIRNWDDYRQARSDTKESFTTVLTSITAAKDVNKKGDVFSRILFHRVDALPLNDLRIALAMRKQYENLISRQVEGVEYQAEQAEG